MALNTFPFFKSYIICASNCFNPAPASMDLTTCPIFLFSASPCCGGCFHSLLVLNATSALTFMQYFFPAYFPTALQ